MHAQVCAVLQDTRLEGEKVLGATVQTDVLSAVFCASKRAAACYGAGKDSGCYIAGKGIESHDLRRVWKSLFPSAKTGFIKFTGMSDLGYRLRCRPLSYRTRPSITGKIIFEGKRALDL